VAEAGKKKGRKRRRRSVRGPQRKEKRRSPLNLDKNLRTSSMMITGKESARTPCHSPQVKGVIENISYSNHGPRLSLTGKRRRKKGNGSEESRMIRSSKGCREWQSEGSLKERRLRGGTC
jgi:hypothetical protein